MRRRVATATHRAATAEETFGLTPDRCVRQARLWPMLAALVSTFALSQAFRTMPALVVGRIADEFTASPEAIGLFAGAFSIAFGAMQLPIGVALDRFGPRRTVCALFPVAVLGAAVSMLAPNFPMLIAGQILLGAGCAPAYISTLVFIVRRYPPARFAALSGLSMSFGSLGMIITATPLAWVVQGWGWRAAFGVLCVVSVISFAACFALVGRWVVDRAADETLGAAFRGIGPILRLRQTAGILCLGCALYGTFLAVRTPWIVPLFGTRYGYSLVDAGNVILVFSLAMVVSPLPFGRLDPGGRRRRYVLIGGSYTLAFLILMLGLPGKAAASIDWVLAVLVAIMSGCAILQYPDVRSSYAPAITGRAIALLNMAMFFGVAVVQWLAGTVASLALAHGMDPIPPIFATLAGLVAVATTAYWVLPWPRAFDAGGEP